MERNENTLKASSNGNKQSVNRKLWVLSKGGQSAIIIVVQVVWAEIVHISACCESAMCSIVLWWLLSTGGLWCHPPLLPFFWGGGGQGALTPQRTTSTITTTATHNCNCCVVCAFFFVPFWCKTTNLCKGRLWLIVRWPVVWKKQHNRWIHNPCVCVCARRNKRPPIRWKGVEKGWKKKLIGTLTKISK